MKKISSILVLACLLLVAATSCKKDDKKEDTVLGKWTLVKGDWKQTFNGQVFTGSETFSASDVATFNENKTFTWTAGEESMAGTWTQDGNIITLSAMEDDQPVQVEYTIKTLTSTTLIVHSKTVDEAYSYEATVELKR